MAIRTYLAMTGEEIAGYSEMPENAAWMVCPFSDDWEEVPWQLQDHPFLVLTDGVQPESAAFEDLISKICALEPRQVLLDFQQKKGREVDAFAESLRRSLQCPVIASHNYADGKNGPVFLPPVPLHARLCDHIASWKDREIWLDISAEGEQIILTETGAAVKPLSHIVPEGIVHQEKNLHCHYTISLQEDSAVFALWRTQEDLEDLLQEAETLGIQNAIGLYQEWQGSSRMPFRGEC